MQIKAPLRRGFVNMNKYIEKIAQLVSTETKRDIANTGVIAGLGAAGNVLADKIMHGPKGGGAKAALIGGGIGLAADYAGIKLNKKINEHIN